MSQAGPTDGHCWIKAEGVLTMHQSSDADPQELGELSQTGIRRPVTWRLGEQVHQLGWTNALVAQRGLGCGRIRSTLWLSSRVSASTI